MMYGFRRDWVVFEELLGQDELPWSNAVLVGSVATGEHRAESAVKHSMPATYSTFINVSRAGTEYSTAYRLQHPTTGWIRLVTEGVPEHSNDTGATRIEAVDDTWISVPLSPQMRGRQ
jgi:hypothetical protein